MVVCTGLSGLQSAYLLQKASLSAIVLEVRDRVGEKTWTTDRVRSISTDNITVWHGLTTVSFTVGGKKYSTI